MLKQFFCRKKQVQSNRSPKWRFLLEEIKGYKYQMQLLGRPKGTYLPGTTSYGVFCVKICSSV